MNSPKSMARIQRQYPSVQWASVVALTACIAWGQTGPVYRPNGTAAPTPTVRGGDQPPPFPAIERAERLKRLEEQRRFEEKRRLQLHDIKRLIQLALHKEDVQERLGTLLQGERVLLEMQKEKPDRRVTELLIEIRRLIYAQPPPPVVRLGEVFEFVLVPGDDQVPPFYALHRPLTIAQVERLWKDCPKEVLEPGPPAPGSVRGAPGKGPAEFAELSCEQAVRVCRALSRETGFPVALPTAEQARKLELPEGCAIWTGTRPRRVGAADDRLMRKYGVVFYSIVDPGRVLGGGAVVSEVPFARYQGLRVVLVTPVDVGKEVRIRRLRGE